MKTLCSILICLLSISWASSQCLNNVQYPSNTINVIDDGTVQTIDFCNYAGDFALLNGLRAGNTYTFDASISSYITLYSGDGSTLIAHGLSPLTVAVTSASVQVHYNLDAACGVATTCIITSIINETVLSSFCNDPSLNISNITETTADISWNPGTNNDSFTAEVYLTGQNAANGDTPVYSYTGNSNATQASGLQDGGNMTFI